MSDNVLSAQMMFAAGQHNDSNLHSGIPEKRAHSAFAPFASGLRRPYLEQDQLNTRPSHDLSISTVIHLIEKRLKWIDRTDLRLGVMTSDNHDQYLIELVEGDQCAVYNVHVDAHDGRFSWVEADNNS